jgi:hypothetical protein
MGDGGYYCRILVGWMERLKSKIQRYASTISTLMMGIAEVRSTHPTTALLRNTKPAPLLCLKRNAHSPMNAFGAAIQPRG